MIKQAQQSLFIDASPTKELFIEMLTRDFALIPAIIDLVDNSTDGARRLRGFDKLESLNVDVEALPDKFVVVDNCGGIPVEIARDYAFRFGRPKGAPKPQAGEVGRFGVGMKRGLFKLGRIFKIRSTTASTQFDVSIDVEKWKDEPEWQFEFAGVPTTGKKFPEAERGTRIEVTKLHDVVIQHFEDKAFIEELRVELTAKLETPILNGLTVRVNKVALRAHPRMFISSPELLPAKKTMSLKGPSGGTVKVDLMCGLGKPKSPRTARSETGWYVFCNGRMLLEADKSPTTGWGTAIPDFHPQFYGFRGFAYLEADDAADLPWNTGKTQLDTDHPVYRSVKEQMNGIARPVFDFFNQMKVENDLQKEKGIDKPGRLQKLLDSATEVQADSIATRERFTFPIPALKRKDQSTQSITFSCDKGRADRVKANLRARSWSEVGEEVFDYYFRAECGR
jgi:hypothetical protein